ncbi:P-loop containing nucleoside triphosphate hydrolase protein [Dentipellis sp. KUC8613]|nr:P-loop containing nucleoside triphosphate hydrolase protein [Dentipellis sp. KUC8613]
MDEVPDALDVRVVTTIGHVDHGKTTLMDSLLAANNIISTRMAGKIRYLDSREDEQERGITMESSSVSLRFKATEKGPDGGSSSRTYVINMIDTPGHVDFSSEVSTASRLVDGALVLVDVVEGVSSQTVSVLRQAWQDRLRPILVINKLDRLVTELRQSPTEAYHHMSQLIEQANAVMGSFFAGERMEDDLRWREDRERRLARKKESAADEADAIVNETNEFQEKDDEDIYFSPEKGNVVFTSAIDGWGFRVGKFAQIFAVKLGIKEANFRRVLWGDFYLDPKTKRVISYKHLRGRVLKPLFVQFVLENVWAVYDAVVLNPNPDKITKIVSTLQLKIPLRELNSKDTRHLLSLIFSQWLPLSISIIQSIIDIIPSPRAAQPIRIPRMLHPEFYEPTVAYETELERDLYSCNSGATASIVAYASKMFAVPSSDLPENKKQHLTVDGSHKQDRKAEDERLKVDKRKKLAESSLAIPTPTTSSLEIAAGETEDDEGGLVKPDNVLLGFARLYSGTIRVGATISCVLPKYNNALGPRHPRNQAYIADAIVEGLYIMMGRDLVAAESVGAGNVFAIKGLQGKIWRCGTLCAPGIAGDRSSGGWIINLGAVNRQAPPIVRVALEPIMPADMPKLLRGMKLLSQADPCAETFQQSTGEHVILTAGELHLERCLKDLRERFAKVEIHASKPIVPFRETAIKASEMAPPKTPNAPRGTILASSYLNIVSFTIRAMPLPIAVTTFIRDNVSVLKMLQSERAALEDSAANLADEDEEATISGDVIQRPTVRAEDFWVKLEVLFQKAGAEWANVVNSIWAFGPHGAGECILIDTRVNNIHNSLRSKLDRARQGDGAAKERDQLARDVDSHIETGFQIATFQGPLCAEPVQGVAYFLERVKIDKAGVERERLQNRMSQVTGSLISAAKDACRNALLDWSPRLMLAMYSCDIQASTDVLGRVYGVVAKRRGRVVAEEMKEGTSFFTVQAMLPVVESFGFADDIRKRTSGAASPQLVFSGYELLDQDPFWVPTTEEELEDLGEKADRQNVAKVYMDEVRERKGMFVDRKIVEYAEKQRTLKR